MMRLSCALLLLALSVSEAWPSKKFEPIRELLKGWEFTENYAIQVGSASGQLFLYEGGNFTMRTQVPTGSTSKWPSAMMFAGLVNDGTISSLDDPINKYLSFWTKKASDPRSKVTFRMLLTFTSGFGDGHPGQEMNTRAAREWRVSKNLSASVSATPPPPSPEACDTMKGSISECAKSIYEDVQLIGTPGTVFSYNSNHLQLAAGVAVAVMGLPIHQVVKKYLLEPYGMTESYYEGKCPDFAGSLVTTGRDYGKFLDATLNYKVLSKALVEESEKDATPFMSDSYSLYGNYAFGHFLMCYDSYNGMTARCREAKCHMDPGAFGYIPIIDRKYGYYVQLVAAEFGSTGFYPLSGIPEYLAVAIKHNIDAVMSADPPPAEEHMHYTPRFMSLGVADVNYCLNCKLHPEQCD